MSESVMSGEEVILSSTSTASHLPARLEELELDVWAGQHQNILALSIMLALALLTNLSAAPVILFRRTRFGNGQFACLILCLTMTDLVTTMSGLVGGLVLEVGHMSWVGSSQGCAAYYFISSWMLVNRLD